MTAHGFVLSFIACFILLVIAPYTLKPVGLRVMVRIKAVVRVGLGLSHWLVRCVGFRRFYASDAVFRRTLDH